MKKLIIIPMLLTLLLVGCATKKEPIPTVVHTRYTEFGRYYTDGTVVTDDGNDSQWWEYSTDTISNKIPYDGIPVWVVFDDNGTADDITDDIILGLVYDRNTAIYDALEVELSAEFDIERDGNNIRVKPLERSDD